MERSVITIVKKVNFAFEKFIDFVYIEHAPKSSFDGRKPIKFIVRRDYFDTREAKNKNYNWILNIPAEKRWYVYSVEYIKQYVSTGDWSTNLHSSGMIEDPLEYLRSGNNGLVYQRHPQLDGFLYRDDKPVLRAFRVNFYDCYKSVQFYDWLKTKKKVVSVKIRHDYEDDTEWIEATFMPTQHDFDTIMKDFKSGTQRDWVILEYFRKQLRIPKKFIDREY